MRRSVIFALALLAVAAAAGLRAETLPLPSNLVDMKSADGARLFLESEAHAAYFPLSINFVTQKTQSYCGVASIVMVLNAMELPAPAVLEYTPYRTFTQDNVLYQATDRILPRPVLAMQGMTLDQLGALLSGFGVSATVRHAAEADADAFRREARRHLETPGQFVVVNYLRKAIGQEKGGHISPLAAYDADTDRFLILDVARYKYPPVWVKTAELFAAMNTTDSDNADRTRGYVLVAKKPAAAQ